MRLSEYQPLAMQSAFHSRSKHLVSYAALGLVGEIGEVANEVKKYYRDDGEQLFSARSAKILDESGDVLWYCAALATDLGDVLPDHTLLPKWLPPPMACVLFAARTAGQMGAVAALYERDQDLTLAANSIMPKFPDLLSSLQAVLYHAGYTIEDAMQANLDKLMARKKAA